MALYPKISLTNLILACIVAGQGIAISYMVVERIVLQNAAQKASEIATHGTASVKVSDETKAMAKRQLEEYERRNGPIATEN